MFRILLDRAARVIAAAMPATALRELTPHLQRDINWPPAGPPPACPKASGIGKLMPSDHFPTCTIRRGAA